MKDRWKVTDYDEDGIAEVIDQHLDVIAGWHKAEPDDIERLSGPEALFKAWEDTSCTRWCSQTLNEKAGRSARKTNELEIV